MTYLVRARLAPKFSHLRVAIRRPAVTPPYEGGASSERRCLLPPSGTRDLCHPDARECRPRGPISKGNRRVRSACKGQGKIAEMAARSTPPTRHCAGRATSKAQQRPNQRGPRQGRKEQQKCNDVVDWGEAISVGVRRWCLCFGSAVWRPASGRQR